MKEKIEFILTSVFSYQISDTDETDLYYIVRLNDTMITNIVLRELIENELEFVIDFDDFKDGQIAIAFEKM